MSQDELDENETIEVSAHVSASTHDKSILEAPGEVLRIESPLSVSWSGVSGCCDTQRITNEVKSDFDRWVGQQIAANPGSVHLNSGHSGGQARCSSSRAPWPDNSRSCRGSITVQAFIEFQTR